MLTISQKTLSAFDKPCWASLEQTSHLPKHLTPEIKPVNPKGNQSSIFIGRTDDEAEVPILWPPDAKN